MSLAVLLQKLKERLSSTFDENEIRQFYYMLAEFYLGLSRTDIHTTKELNISDDQLLKINSAIDRLAKSEPIQYIIGYADFYDYQFKVFPGVLIPRPETEELVDWIISSHMDSGKNINIIDIGSGSGCIAVSLALNIENSSVFAVDNDPRALKAIQENSKLHHMKIQTIEADILENNHDLPLKEIDIIVSNPPYVLESDKLYMHKNVLHFEPENALFVSDHDPLRFYSVIINYGKAALKKSGYIYFEIHEKMGANMIDLLEKNNFYDITLKQDIHDKDRMIRARYDK